MNKNILYITFVDFNEQKSGSSVRPKKIYDAFIEEGYNVSLLTGQQNRKLERWKNCFKYYKEIRKNKYEFCYVEPPAGPIFNLSDHLLLLYISKIKKVPTGLFYRDAYWKFADWYEVSGLKKFIINTMHKFDWFIIKNVCKKIFFPTDMMGDLFDFKCKEALPPACELLDVKRKNSDIVEIIYVGGMSEQYGGKLLLESLDKVNNNKRMNLHLVCREEDAEKIKEYKDKEWLKIYHASGKELKKIYSKANIAIIPRKVDFYMDFAMPVKLFEYISFGLPIISTNCKEVAKFINSNKIGVICDDNIESLYNTLVNIKIDDVKEYSRNVEITRVNNTWNKRIEQISKLKNK
ncbi:glycosyltransferase [Clostridium carnis]